MKFAMKSSFAQFNLSPWVIQTLSMALWLSCVSLTVWFLIHLLAPAPQAAPAMPMKASTKYQIDRSPEARLMGVETTGGLTPPSLTLLGVFANNEGKGAAVIGVDGQPGQFQRVGDEIINGWILVEVGPTFAVIRRSGLRQQINLPILQVDPELFHRVPNTQN
jgi:general secretion pathway protein C